MDLIALDGECIVFVEVKTRSSHAAGHPSEAVTFEKRRQLTRVALAWLKRRGLLDHRARFDVIAITWKAGADPVVEHYKNAFEPVGAGQLYS
jgi:putative endonuclease